MKKSKVEVNVVGDIDIVEAKELSQIGEIVTLAKKIWNEHYVPIIGKAQVDYMISKFQSLEAIRSQIEEGLRYFIVHNNEKKIGYFAIDIDQKGNSLFISKFYIDKKFRGQGVAKSCLSYMENICMENQLNRLWLTVNKNNNDSIKAYERMGFERIEELVVGIGCGFVMDDYKMEKEV